MDALKPNELALMAAGGNKPWRDFFDAHVSNTSTGTTFENCTIAERYDSPAAEEWRGRLQAKVDGREYVPGAPKPKQPKRATVEDAVDTPSGSGRNTPLGAAARMTSPPQRTASPSQKARNEEYFARMGNANASRAEGLPPNQGGKYAGFGSGGAPSSSQQNGNGFADDLQKDPVAALTKGFGWLSSTVTRQAAQVNKAYIQPSVKSIADGEFAAQARQTALNLGSTVQQGTKGLGDQFSKFVDPDAQPSSAPLSGRRAVEPEKKDFWDSFGADPNGPPKEKKEFWDDFSNVAAESKAAKPTNLGTSALKPGNAEGGSGSSHAPIGGRKEDGGWGDW